MRWALGLRAPHVTPRPVLPPWGTRAHEGFSAPAHGIRHPHPRPTHLSCQELNANLNNLTSAFEKATAEKIKCQQEADATNRVISLANR